MTTTIAANLSIVKLQIQQWEAKYARSLHSVSLLAVSKGQPVEAIKQARAAGQLAFGENYLQEALTKIADIADPCIDWHFIGPIQSNKTKKIAEHFHWVHTVSDARVAERLNDQRPLHLPPLNICIQVNTSQEATKSGIYPDELHALAGFCAGLPRLTLRGLMTIPAPCDDLGQQRLEFQKLYKMYENLTSNGFVLDTLSMGMSHDLEAAIAEGATIVRVGTAIFGPRK